MITKRVIHTSADFDYAKTLVYSEGAVPILEGLIRDGADIVTDTNMALAGINKKALAGFGGEAHCFMAEEETARQAKERNMTRAAVSMEMAAKLGKRVVFVIGNAPTALIRLYEMAEKGDINPDFIIGVPVGFVNVEAAKEPDIVHKDPPYHQYRKKGREQCRRGDLQCGSVRIVGAWLNAYFSPMNRPAASSGESDP